MFPPRRARDGNPNRSHGSAPRARRKVEAATVLAHDGISDRQPEAGTLPHRLGREERLENPLPKILGDSLSGVTDGDGVEVPFGPRRDGDLALSFDGVDGVRHYVEQRLIEQAREAFDLVGL